MSEKTTMRQWVMQGLAPVTAVGLAAYSAIGAANEAFFDHFGVSVERVGLDASTVLARALVVAVPLLTLYGILGTLVLVSAVAVGGAPWLVASQFSDRRRVRLIAHATLAAGVVIFTAVWPSARRSDWRLAAMLVAVGVALHAVGLKRLRRFYRSRARTYLMVGSATAAFLIVVVTSWFLGAHWAAQFEEGKPLTASTAAYVLLPRWPERVTVRPIDEAVKLPAPAPRESKLLYLGTKDGQLVLYDTEYDEVVRLPAGSVTLQTSH